MNEKLAGEAIVIGDKVGAEYMCFLGGESGRDSHCAWFSKIEVNGKKVFIRDVSEPRGIKQADSRYLAVKMAKEFRDLMKGKEVNG
ncbi:hypothetical protein ACFOQM_23515 [Paenibacillus sp. GCM10012307]|uniref:Uncharacterized protein n=1 Tax=Paenibacillus roseus TaxID=2798579 RepID=A0A934JBU4_9BACL|nr:hypothetical protein [Paenibacillus roseus]MBJ6364192.1 hypothetical protein [Paenibacillus roseus]